MYKKLVVDYKNIHDNIHGYISISNLAYHIINSEEFQRLRKIKQLGTCVYAFPNAYHNRFVHSIGTYYLAGRILNCIVKNTLPGNIDDYLKSIRELENYFDRQYTGKVFVLDEYVCELIKIAALCHDLGHGPFSHVFDDYFLTTKDNPHPNDTHEERSKLLLERIIKKNTILRDIIKESEIEFMKNIINPRDFHFGFIYQIVSNNLNGLDVDKFDYIARDSYVLGLQSGFDHSGLVDHVKIIENNIVYPERVCYEIKKMYETRYSLHKQIYNHKLVISSQLMIVELFKILDPILHLYDSVENMDNYCKLTDEFIFDSVDHKLDLYQELIKYCPEYESKIVSLNKAKEIIHRINNHNMYKFIGYCITDSNFDISIEDYKNLNNFEDNLTNSIIIFKTKIGFVSGNKKNPLENIYTYSTGLFDCNKLQTNKISIHDISLITPKIYQEYITMIYSKSDENSDILKIHEWTKNVLHLKKQSINITHINL